MANPKAPWRLIGLLPNLSMQGSIGTQDILAVASSDPRMSQVLHADATQNFAGRFTDQFGRPVTPAAILYRRAKKPDAGAVAAFRNVLAISAIVRAWRRQRTARFGIGAMLYSNYFDIYPYSLTVDAKHLVVSTPSLTGLDGCSKFRGQRAAGLAPHHSGSLDFDARLLEALLPEWEANFVRRPPRSASDTLFRSLEMAYRAAAMPHSSMGSIHDHGTSLALWVSAIEILFHPTDRYVDLSQVIAGLEALAFPSRRLRARSFVVTIGRKRRNVTRVAKAYSEIYIARNNFLHGNPVTSSSLFTRERRRELLTSMAPVVYGAALYARLRIYPKLREAGEAVTLKWAPEILEWEGAFLRERVDQT